MTRFDAATPTDRGTLVAEAIAAHRTRDGDRAVFVGVADDATVDLQFADGQIVFEVTERQRDRLDAVLAEFPVFKVAQPETRKASTETVHVSAVTDAKHAAEFLETAFRSVYDLPTDYRLWVVEI